MYRLVISILIYISTVGSCLSHLQPLSLLRLHEVSPRKQAPDQTEPSPYIPALMLLDADGSARAELEALGVIFYHHRAGIFLTSIPRERVQEVVNTPGIIDISCANTASACMDKAREFSFVDAVLLPSSDILPYTGQGVITGISDIGFDPHHIAFKNNLAGMAIFTPEYDSSQIWDKNDMAQSTTDTDTQRHATHVGNILAGSYMDCPYYGVAPQSEFIATTSTLNDVGILLGVEHIINYAKTAGQRAVINLSLSTLMGPHDGTSLMSAYLNLAAEDAVICISSGNQGNCEGYAFNRFTKALPEASLGLSCYKNLSMNNYVDIWSADEHGFKVRLGVFDTTTGIVVYTSDWSDPYSTEPYIIEPDFISGSVKMQSYVSPMNNRFNLTMRLDYTTDILGTDNRTARYVPFLTVSAPEGVSVEARADVSPLVFTNAPASLPSFKVMCDGTVNDMATGENLICVGSARSRNTAPTLTGDPAKWDYEVGTVSDWSSFSSATPFCRALPDICAPGQYVISATSSYYMATHPNFKNNALTVVDGVDYFWHADQGTSMSSPFVAGVIALWLEADPSLSVEDIKKIATKSARTDFTDFPSAQWGPGSINAMAGIEEIQRLNSGIAEITVPTELPTAIYSLSGTLLPHSDISRLSPGAYILCFPTSARKIFIK